MNYINKKEKTKSVRLSL